MNNIKREIDDFIGSKPRFTHQIKKQILNEMEGSKFKQSSTFFSNYKHIAVSILFITLATFFVFSIVNKNEATTPTNSATGEDSSFVVENEELQNQLSAIEDNENVKGLTEEIAQRFLLAMSLGEKEAIEPLLLPGSTLEDDFSITFSDGYTYNKPTWNLYENIVFTKLNGYGFQEDSKDKRIYNLHYQFTPKKKGNYYHFTTIQFELVDDTWFISNVYEDV
ncbi:hypothetical protein [Paenisporosarcina indica]|uniref:hypothetical protein n=1 Tax=Paenisporosarcina indica TaxID=650093 RepID=UPI0009501E2C|nr:hypothetical protein [Paenisporosarcina indica]